MALALTFKQSNNGKTLTITDASDTGTVLTGAAITIEFNDQTFSPTLTDWDTPGDESVEVSPSDLNQDTDKFTDGVYKVYYTNDAPGDDDVSYNVLLNYNVKYCVYNILRQLPDIHSANDLCTRDEIKQATAMYTFLKSLEYSAACGQVNEIQTILAMLQKLCLNPRINECYCN